MNLQEKFQSLVDTLKPIPLPSRCLVISDVHASSGGDKDPLVGAKVESTLLDILVEHYDKEYFLLKNGDWWDTWRAGGLVEILRGHRRLMEIVDVYKGARRLFETLGNHERDLCSYPEAVVFEGFGKKIFMFHGWFGDWPNDEGWKIGRSAVRMASELGLDPETSPHPSNAERHLAIRTSVQELADANPDWEFLWGHSHYFDTTGNNHNSGSSLIGFVQGFTIEEGEIIPFERR